MRFEVRNTAGSLLGSVQVQNLQCLKRGVVSFARASRPRYYGVGLLELPDHAVDPSFHQLDMTVSMWWSAPQIDKKGIYRSGRVDYCLIWDGPVMALADVWTFQEAREQAAISEDEE